MSVHIPGLGSLLSYVVIRLVNDFLGSWPALINLPEGHVPGSFRILVPQRLKISTYAQHHFFEHFLVHCNFSEGFIVKYLVTPSYFFVDGSKFPFKICQFSGIFFPFSKTLHPGHTLLPDEPSLVEMRDAFSAH